MPRRRFPRQVLEAQMAGAEARLSDLRHRNADQADIDETLDRVAELEARLL